MTSSANTSQRTGQRAQRKLQRRGEILDIARLAFLQRGYAGTTMSEIAAQMGGSKSTLWAYFSTKEVLFSAVLEREANEFERNLADSLNFNDDIKKSILQFCIAYSNLISSPDSISLHRLVIAEGVRFPEIGTSFYECAIAKIRQKLIEFLSGASERGMLAIPNPASAAEILRSLCHGNRFQTLLLNLHDTPYIFPEGNDAKEAAEVFLTISSHAHQSMTIDHKDDKVNSQLKKLDLD